MPQAQSICPIIVLQVFVLQLFVQLLVQLLNNFRNRCFSPLSRYHFFHGDNRWIIDLIIDGLRDSYNAIFGEGCFGASQVLLIPLDNGNLRIFIYRWSPASMLACD